MKRFYFLALGSVLALGSLLLLLGWMQTSRASVAARPLTPAAPTQAATSEIVIGLSQEPSTLYIYGNQYDPSTNQVLEALQDGPIDVLDYDYVPVILEKLPALEHGDAAISLTTVYSGDLIYSDDEVFAYSGSPTTVAQLHVTFTLRNDVRWCDGRPLTSQDSAFSFRVQRDTPYTYTDHTETERTFTYTVESTYSVRWVGLPGYLDASFLNNFWTPLPYHVLSATLPADIPGSNYARAPLGWGPFCFTEWTSDHITLDRGPYYWQAGLPKLDRLVFRWDSQDEALIDDVVAGRVQVGLNIGGSEVVDLERAGALQSVMASGTAWEHIDFNLARLDAPSPTQLFGGGPVVTLTQPFSDVLVRRAIAYGTDRQRMIDELLYGVGAPLNAYVPDSHPAYPTATAMTYAYNPTQANTLLDAAGWAVMTDGMRYKDGQPLAFVHRTTDAELRRGVGAIFQENMAAIGVSVTLEFWDPGEFFDGGPQGPVFGRWFDTAEYAWISDPEPPGDLYVCDQIPGPEHGWWGFNNTGYCNPAYDDAVYGAMNTLTRSESLDLWRAAITTFTQDLPVLPLFNRVDVAAASPELVGFELNPTENALWNVELWDIVASGTISEGGGQVVSNSGNTTVTIPSDAVSETAIVTLTPQSAPADPSPGLGATSHFFDLEAVAVASGRPISFSRPVSVTIHYNDVEVADLFEDSLALYRWVGETNGFWEPIGARQGETYTLDIENNTLTAYLLGFSRFGSLGVAVQRRLYLPLMLKN